MRNYDYIKKYIEEEPKGRLRRNKDRAIVNVLLRRFKILQDIPKETLVEFVKEHSSMDRSWRKVMEENPQLRGDDYEDKEVLEQTAQINLGYEPLIKLKI